MSRVSATLCVERELKDELQVIEYEVGNGDIHFHSQIEICIVEDGAVEALVNNSKRTLRRGDIAISLSYDSHQYYSANDGRYSVLILPSDICEKFYAVIQSKRLSSPFICDTSDGARFLEMLSLIKSEETNNLSRVGYVFLLLGIIRDALSAKESKEKSDSELLSRLLLYIDENYSKSLTLTSISRTFGYHPAYISSYFKSGVNISIIRYINVVRLKNAILMMRQKKRTATQIAIDSGFGTTRTFYRVFRNEFGCSPKEYIMNHA